MTHPSLAERHWIATPCLAIATVLIGLNAGFFATYVYSVTRALKHVPDETYVISFQAINATIRGVEFGIIFFGSLPALVLATVLHRRTPWLRYCLVLATLGYAATLAITFIHHIPLNNALALVDATQGASDARAWFESPWNRWHLWRTLTVCTAFVLTVIAMAHTTGNLTARSTA